MARYILRLFVNVEGTNKYWTIEKPIETECLPNIGNTISILADNEKQQVLFEVVSIVFYPERDVGPLVIANVSASDEKLAGIIVEQIRAKFAAVFKEFS